MKRLAPVPRPVLNERGINMVDLMMWLVIAALLLASAIQSIGYYQQSAYVYQAKNDLASAHTWAAAKVAETSSAPTANDMKDALLKGDLKLTSANIGVIAASGGAKYCIGVTDPSVNGQKMFYSSSDSINDVQRGDDMAAYCGTSSSVTAGGVVTSGSSTGGSTSTTTALPAVSTARLRFGVSETNGPLSPEVDNVARLVNEYPGIVSTYKDFTQPFNATEVQAVYDKGAQPMITWEPFDSTQGITQPAYQLNTIYNGAHDAEIKSWTDSIAATNYSKPIMIRFAHEMNGNWYPWAQQVNGNTDGDYIKAWQYVYNKFTAAGIKDKVNFVWSPNVPYTGSMDYYKLYPGDAYVDTIGIDGFNFGTTDQYSTWTAPWNVLGGGLWNARHANGDANVTNGKPIIIGETGSVPSEGANSQAQWVSDLVYWLNTDAGNTDVTGFVWFDQVKYDQLSLGQTKATDWRLSTTQATADAMKAALAGR